MIRKLRVGSEIIEYELTRKSVKNINLRIKNDGSIHVSANRAVPLNAIEAFIVQKSELILKTIRKFSSVKKNDDVIYILGNEIPMHREISDTGKIEILYDGEQVRLKLLALDDDNSVQWLTRRFIEHFSEELLYKFFDEAYERCRSLTKSKPVLKLGFRKTVWGTCHPKKNQIILNRKLIMLPKECIDAVILHEFCHFVSIRHDNKFYNVLARILPDLKKRDKLLKEYEVKLTNYRYL